MKYKIVFTLFFFHLSVFGSSSRNSFYIFDVYRSLPFSAEELKSFKDKGVKSIEKTQSNSNIKEYYHFDANGFLDTCFLYKIRGKKAASIGVTIYKFNNIGQLVFSYSRYYTNALRNTYRYDSISYNNLGQITHYVSVGNEGLKVPDTFELYFNRYEGDLAVLGSDDGRDEYYFRKTNQLERVEYYWGSDSLSIVENANQRSESYFYKFKNNGIDTAFYLGSEKQYLGNRIQSDIVYYLGAKDPYSKSPIAYSSRFYHYDSRGFLIRISTVCASRSAEEFYLYEDHGLVSEVISYSRSIKSYCVTNYNYVF